MRTVKFTELITKSFDKTGEVLFDPFVFKKWLRWTLIMVLSGSMAGASCNFYNSSGKHNKSPHSTTVSIPSAVHKNSSKIAVTSSIHNHKDSSFKGVPSLDHWAWGMVAVIGVLFISLMVFFTWLQARFKFIWFRVLTSGDVPITRIFGEYRAEGRSLFRFYLLNILIIMAGILIPLCAGIALEKFSKFNIYDIGIWWVFIIFLVFCIVFLIYWSIVVALYVGNFVVLIMATDRCAFHEAWQKFWKIYWAHRGDFAGYLLSLILMFIVLGIAMCIIVLILIIGVLLAGLLIFGMLYLVLDLLLKLHLLFIILAVLIGIPFILGTFVLIYMAYLPSSVFASCFSYYFFSSLNAGYQPLSLNAPAQPKEPL